MSNDNLPPTPAKPDASADKPQKYYVRFSKAEDEQKILEFYDLNAHHNVRKREADILKNRIEDGSVVLVEDEHGKIVAASISYPHKTVDSEGEEHIKWQEVGSTRIALNGYPGLFDAMVTMQVLRTSLVEPPEDRLVARMHTEPVQKMAEKLGWRRFNAPEDLILLQKKSVNPNDQSAAPPDANWFHMGIEGLPVMAKWMVETLRNPVLENRKTGEKIELDFTRSSFFNMFEQEIRHLAKRDFGTPDAPDMNKGLEKSRNKWLKNFFR